MYIRIIYLDLSNTSKRIIIIIIRKYKGIFQRSIETTPVYLLVISSFHVSRIFQKQCLITTFPCHPSSHPRHNYSSDSKSERERETHRSTELDPDVGRKVRSRSRNRGSFTLHAKGHSIRHNSWRGHDRIGISNALLSASSWLAHEPRQVRNGPL